MKLTNGAEVFAFSDIEDILEGQYDKGKYVGMNPDADSDDEKFIVSVQGNVGAYKYVISASAFVELQVDIKTLINNAVGVGE